MKEIDLLYIKDKRLALGKTLQDMADSLGIKNASTYLKYENGTYAFKANQLPKLASEFDCTIEDFFKKKVAISAT